MLPLANDGDEKAGVELEENPGEGDDDEKELDAFVSSPFRGEENDVFTEADEEDDGEPNSELEAKPLLAF